MACRYRGAIGCLVFWRKIACDNRIHCILINWLLTCWIILKIIKVVFTFCIISFDFRSTRSDSQWSKPYMLPILYCQYHSCWSPGDLRSQGISKHGIDWISWNISSIRRVTSHYKNKGDPILLPQQKACDVEWFAEWCTVFARLQRSLCLCFLPLKIQVHKLMMAKLGYHL